MRKDASRPQRKLWRDSPAQMVAGANGRRRAQARPIRQEALIGVMGEAVVKAAQAIPNRKLCLEHAGQIGA